LNAIAIHQPETWSTVVHLARRPKGILIGILTAFVVVAAPFVGAGIILPNLIASVVVAALLDVAIVKALRDEWVFPDGAILTGLIVAMVLRPQEPVIVAAAIAAIAIASKHALRTRWSNVFNPAALALVVGALLFQAGQSWWGALPDAGILGLVVVGAGGGFIADRINKLPLVAVFLGTYFALFTLSSFMGNPATVSEIFRTPDLQAALFLAFFMLDDPPTCPIRYEDQAVFGAIVAVVSFGIFKLIGADYYLAAGVLAGNAWESGRRLWIQHESRVNPPQQPPASNRQFMRPTAPDQRRQLEAWAPKPRDQKTP
jgi:Na+-translocating ferredoxin:NAD+ oxidoreductase RnfD subunit